MDVVSVFALLSALKMAKDNNLFHEEAAMYLVLHFINRTAAAELTARLSLKPKLATESTVDRVLATYSLYVTHSLET